MASDDGLTARLWLGAIQGRARYVIHALVGHQVGWSHHAAEASSCTGDIVCITCDSVLWCRGMDPWFWIASSPPTDHWGTLNIVPALLRTGESEPAGDGATSRVARQALEARLNHLLALADRLPHGSSEDFVRRSVCALIEADQADQAVKVLTLMRSIRQLQDERRLGLRRAQQRGAAAVDRVLASLRDEVVPMLPQLPFARRPPQKTS
jgi:hypothetical protein